MSRTLSNLNTRLAKVEQQVADLAMRQKLANCNCYLADWPHLPSSRNCIR
jgi:hypothetical protein